MQTVRQPFITLTPAYHPSSSSNSLNSAQHIFELASKTNLATEPNMLTNLTLFNKRGGKQRQSINLIKLPQLPASSN